MMQEIPEAFQIPPFYHTSDLLTQLEDPKIGSAPPFYFDMLHLIHPSLLEKWPWESDEGADLLWKSWEEKRSIPEASFRKRKPNEAMPIMIQLTAQLICYLFWSEGKSVTLEEDGLETVHRCAIAPVNLDERLRFICDSPAHYHSFIQLTSLFEEARKKRALYRIKHKG